jgi:hypothetical protein
MAEEEMARHGWSEAELEQRRKADVEKIEIAQRLRAETTMTWGWTAERLAMGTSGYTADCRRKTWPDMRICGTDRFPIAAVWQVQTKSSSPPVVSHRPIKPPRPNVMHFSSH